MYRDSQALQEYIISVCMNNQTALNSCMSHLNSVRDFTGKNQQAFALIEAEYSTNGTIDALVMGERFVNGKVFSSSTARYILNAWDNDSDFEPKMNELKRFGVFRKAKIDINEINDLANSDISPEKLSEQAIELFSKWGLGTAKKYQSTEDVEHAEEHNITGRKLIQGIPLLDDVLYSDAGQHTGTVKATIFREKHGKTRHACWEVAQDIRQGHKVMYVTLEGQARDIKNNVKEILKYEWDDFKHNLYYKDATVDVFEICSAIREWKFQENGDKFVIDHMQRIEHPDSRRLSENENGNKCCKAITDLAVKYDMNAHLINQARQPDKYQSGYAQVPKTYDCYGSNQLIKDASLILVGFRPNTDETLIIESMLGTARVKDPDGNEAPFHSVFLKPILSRKKMKYLHRWVHFTDSDQGYKLNSQELL